MAESIVRDIRDEGYHVGTVMVLDRESSGYAYVVDATDAKTGEANLLRLSQRLLSGWMNLESAVQLSDFETLVNLRIDVRQHQSPLGFFYFVVQREQHPDGLTADGAARAVRRNSDGAPTISTLNLLVDPACRQSDPWANRRRREHHR